ncbi:hypothetical protein BDW42DRAFT_194789 [Aspergillus taichungensis]|uniref:Rhodopsin domain-containing protein n=1 Tax=Aspergillus taichungensis TaxID=482145 RepID=A0A2J5HRJ4_9EURO|nr:hypothetical protein BDW42DRAFT_194789 [Aspergillus taichungensis]
MAVSRQMQSPPKPGLVDGTRQASTFGVGISFMVFISIVMLLRVWVRVVVLRALGIDDILMIIGTLLTFGLTIATMVGAYYGLGRHMSDIPPEGMIPMMKAIYATRLLYIIGMGFVKMSLLWFYLRLDHRKLMKWAVYFSMFFTIGLTVSSIFVTVLSCIPPSKFWDPTGKKPGHCISPEQQQIFYEANGALNIVSDILIFLTPIPMLWGIQLSTRKKGALFVVFGLGILSIAASCVRYDFVKRLAATKDQYYQLADSLNWCEIEVFVAIFCGSAPALSVAMKHFFGRVWGSTHGYGSNMQTPGQSYGNRLSTLNKNSRHQRLDESERFGSEDGIVMKTDIRMEVSDRDLEDDRAHGTGLGKYGNGVGV